MSPGLCMLRMRSGKRWRKRGRGRRRFANERRWRRNAGRRGLRCRRFRELGFRVVGLRRLTVWAGDWAGDDRRRRWAPSVDNCRWVEAM
ncbi:unnamed protein product [Arabis nemorensis]|uniref:Uncharacterized protein n=1 Tax=Arabis nemorensis TaxID=586526 RepID=A0A565CU47_9BRAS|nr:unnamed protein product [Arabis nemorensis]